MLPQYSPAPFPTMDGSQPCRRNPELWTPEYPDGAAARRAASICKAECRFLSECRQYGLTNSVAGVLGGLTATGRSEARKRLGIPVEDEAADSYSHQRDRKLAETCKRGHDRTPANGYRHKTKGTWECRLCRRVRDAEKAAERLAAGEARRQGPAHRTRRHLSLVGATA